ncbi:maleylpyruvate isomerase family mycothiol-dependent enzyme [Streptomyces sp. NBC_00199]|uniref:maleylpyruvate isomerase family mycothiol-dependent enzyme n=1 Tax=Streptomyces sp. NBC_00199 TaxID=2975678 RepID=UPI002252CDCB|nr:maleylpyruvate isomerase family mycothiol-dependent enzyme [Streptomyces sp. NBC_00199]MCX5264128.1 maleylpyruvate isomerase family mycothiol-dependent enzyme [Streptomyces sp. NBC_00199]
METADFIEILDREGRALADAAAEAGPDAKVVTCPGWQVRDLLRHTGAVHRWATSFVAEGHTGFRPVEEPPELDDEALGDWFRAGHRRLVDTLSTASPDVRCWHFLPGPTPLAFWARRQAHETAVHRVDAESARGRDLEETGREFTAEFAADGVDELLRGFHARDRSRVRSEEPRALRVRATDTADAVWSVRLSSQPPVTRRGADGPADCEVSGPAALLYLSLWNRLPLPAVTGDAALATLWREKSGVS